MRLLEWSLKRRNLVKRYCINRNCLIRFKCAVCVWVCFALEMGLCFVLHFLLELFLIYLLNRLKTGSQTAENVLLLLSRTLPTSDMTYKNYPLDHHHVFLTNARVSIHNNLVFTLALESKQVKLHALDVVSGGLTSEAKRNILKRIPNDTSRTMASKKHCNLSLVK